MVWTDTQRWLADNQRTVFYRLPVIRRFVTTPDDEAHQDLRERVSTVYGACIDANNSSFDKCHQLYGEVVEQSWIEHGPGGIDPEALSEDNLAGIQQTLTDIKQRLDDTVMTESEPTIDHVPPVDGPLWHTYLTRSERSKIEELERQFAGLRTVGDLAEELRTLRQEYFKLQETLAPFSEFKRYLPTTEKQELLDHLSELDTQITQVQAQLDDPPQAVAEQFDELRVQIETDKQFVSNYSEGNSDFVGFVPREITRYKNSLFSEYDEANHSLNSKQAEAVVRNDQANQIVAGPGTGKTVTLTARIAYLIRGLGIDPDRIVALTFTNEATTEMATRLEQWFDITAVDCSTLHSFGLDIATDYQDTPRDLIKEDDVRNFIEQCVGELLETDSEFQQDYAKFLQRMNDELLDRSAFDSKDELYDARKDKQYTTLKDETVESRAEKVIADWLFAHGIEYQHERLATWAETADNKGTYNPDFYLPEHDLYIEHWGIDENAEVAPWFTWSSEEYLEKLTWVRGQFANTDEYTLINTYEFEHDADRLEAVLEHRLQVNDVPIEHKSYTQLIEDTYRYNNVERRVYNKFLKFVQNAKQFDLSRSDIESNLSEDDPRQNSFAQCGLRLYEEFVDHLESNQLMVFSDMISTAAEAVTDPHTAYGEEYDHVLVDEFQDVSRTNIKLLQELTGDPTGPRLFCVGDDWQSIYSFQGSEVEYFVRFNEYFTASTQTTLTKNYRSPSEIVEAGKTLINNNDRQISKNLTAVADTQTVPRLHILPDTTDYEYKESTGQFAAERTQRYLTDEGSAPGDIMILCHLDKGAPYLDAVKSELKER